MIVFINCYSTVLFHRRIVAQKAHKGPVCKAPDIMASSSKAPSVSSLKRILAYTCLFVARLHLAITRKIAKMESNSAVI